jgi:uncharacterized protein
MRTAHRAGARTVTNRTSDAALPPPVPWGALAVAGVALVGWNAALNLVPFPAWSYVPANLGLAAAAVAVVRRLGVTSEAAGLGRRQRRGLAIGLGVAALVGLGLLLALRVPALAPLLDDERAAGLAGAALVYAAAVRIPLGTALPEEVVFRGALLGALRTRMGWWPAAWCSSVVFGLWHVGPTIVLVRVNALDASPVVAAGVVAGAVVVTTAAGIGFCLLRRWGGGVVAPVLVHSATNAFSLLAAVAAQRAAAGG